MRAEKIVTKCQRSVNILVIDWTNGNHGVLLVMWQFLASKKLFAKTIRNKTKQIETKNRTELQSDRYFMHCSTPVQWIEEIFILIRFVLHRQMTVLMCLCLCIPSEIFRSGYIEIYVYFLVGELNFGSINHSARHTFLNSRQTWNIGEKKNKANNERRKKTGSGNLKRKHNNAICNSQSCCVRSFPFAFYECFPIEIKCNMNGHSTEYCTHTCNKKYLSAKCKLNNGTHLDLKIAFWADIV